MDFSQFEVNEMNILGLRYEVQCRVVDKGVVDEPATEFSSIVLPQGTGEAVPHHHVSFRTLESMSVLHGPPWIGKDQLVAEVTLRSVETGDEKTAESDVIAIDLKV